MSKHMADRKGETMANSHYYLQGVTDWQPSGKLLYISSTSYGRDWLSIMHSHSFAELFYVLDGEGYFCTESSKIPLRKNSLIIINPNTRHTEKSSSANPLKYVVLGIDDARFASSSQNIETYYSYDFHSHQNSILPIFEEMLREIRNNNIHHEEICRHYFSILMLRIHRITGDDFVLSPPVNIPPECENLKEYMNTHYRETITLDTLAEVSHLNKYYLSHIFSRTFGISPINYLLERRILHSKELLKNFDYTVTQIAHQSGFSSANYFTQSFKKYTGLTPKAYRNKYRNPLP